MEFYKLIIFVIQLILYCFILYLLWKDFFSVISTHDILFLVYCSRKCKDLFAATVFLVSHIQAVVLSCRIRYQVHTVKRKHCCVAFKFISVIQVKCLNFHPLTHEMVFTFRCFCYHTDTESYHDRCFFLFSYCSRFLICGSFWCSWNNVTIFSHVIFNNYWDSIKTL